MGNATTAVFIPKVIGSILTFAGLSYFSRTVGAASIGIFFLFLASLSVLAVPADLVISTGVMKRMSESNGNERTVLATGLVAKGLLAGFVAVGILLAQERVNNYIGADVAS